MHAYGTRRSEQLALLNKLLHEHDKDSFYIHVRPQASVMTSISDYSLQKKNGVWIGKHTTDTEPNKAPTILADSTISHAIGNVDWFQLPFTILKDSTSQKDIVLGFSGYYIVVISNGKYKEVFCQKNFEDINNMTAGYLDKLVRIMLSL